MTPLLALVAAVAASLTCAGNFSADLLGPADTRQGTWGRAEAIIKTITFLPGVGQRVRMLGISGDVVAWPRVLDGESPVTPGRYAGILAGFQTTAPEGSAYCDYCADNTMVYVQGGTGGEVVRMPFHELPNRLLEADNKLNVKLAAWLNTTNYPMHLEVVYMLRYRFEGID